MTSEVSGNVTATFNANTMNFIINVNKASNSLNILYTGMNRGTGVASSFAGSIGGVAGGILKAQVLMKAFNVTLGLATTAFKSSFMAVEHYNMSVGSSAALVTSFMKLNPGEALADGYERAYKYSDAVQKKFIQINKNTLADLKQMNLVNTELQKQGVFIDINNEKQLRGFESLTNAIGVMTASMPNANMQYGQEARGLMEGVAKQGNTISLFVKRKLGPEWKNILQDWIRSKTLLENMGELFKGFDIASSKLATSWAVLSSTIQTTMSYILKLGFEDIFKDITEGLAKFNGYLEDNYELIGDKLKTAWGLFALDITTVYNALKPLIEYLGGTALGVLKAAGAAVNVIAMGFAAASGTLDEYMKAYRELTKKSPAEILQEKLQSDTADKDKLVEDLKKEKKEVEKLTETKKKAIKVADDFNKKWLGDKVTRPDAWIKVNAAATAQTEYLKNAEGRVASLERQIALKEEDIKLDEEAIKKLPKDPIVNTVVTEKSVDKELEKDDPWAKYMKSYQTYHEFVVEQQVEMATMVRDTWTSSLEAVRDSLKVYMKSLVDASKTGEEKFQAFADSILTSWYNLIAEMIAQWLFIMVITGGNVSAANAAVSAGMKAWSAAPTVAEKPAGAANGGIIGGTSFSGDKIPIRVNSGEMVLNRRQQTNLFRSLNSDKVLASSSLSSGNSTQDMGIMMAAVISKIETIANKPLNAELTVGDENMRTMARQTQVANYNRRELGI